MTNKKGIYNFFINLNYLLNKVNSDGIFYVSIILGVHAMVRGCDPSFWYAVFRLGVGGCGGGG